ncbi:hypothetical protein EVAR_44395_1 [Eumeta japonica]|uniref:Uncharacterized protein n=1 Tax=Eumeta variegata TaxID=151549 RepID=A0A4C1XRG3_EUMVA|nr:hypothetical protein EVAR_44395_1 [Eumeta japonica]
MGNTGRSNGPKHRRGCREKINPITLQNRVKTPCKHFNQEDARGGAEQASGAAGGGRRPTGTRPLFLSWPFTRRAEPPVARRPPPARSLPQFTQSVARLENTAEFDYAANGIPDLNISAIKRPRREHRQSDRWPARRRRRTSEPASPSISRDLHEFE